MRCGKCNVKLQKNEIYANRKRIPCGLFCPVCCIQVTFSDELRNYQKSLIEAKKAKEESKPKFHKTRKACPYCIQKTPSVINRLKWTIRKMKVKPDESPSWKCTCKICGGIWTTNSGDEFYYVDPTRPKPQEMMGAPF
jgi:hypothetical protein